MPAANGAKRSKLPPQELISVITDTTRWSILQCLDTDKSAKQIAEEIGMKQANCQYHLKQLHKAGLVDEFPMPKFPNRFVYSRHQLQGCIEITEKGLSAEIAFA